MKALLSRDYAFWVFALLSLGLGIGSWFVTGIAGSLLWGVSFVFFILVLFSYRRIIRASQSA